MVIGMYGGGATNGGRSAPNAAAPPATLSATTHANRFIGNSLTCPVPGVARPVASAPGSQTKSSTRRASRKPRPHYRRPQRVSVQRISLTARQHRLNFYVVLRKLIPKLQALSKCIQETSMVRFYSSVYSDDKMLIRKMSGDSAFHGTPPPNRCRTSNKNRIPRQRSRRARV